MCQEYITFASTEQELKPVAMNDSITLKKAIIKGLKKEAEASTRELLSTLSPLDIVNYHIVPALDEVGVSYEKGITFLPQLLMSAETATVAFDVVKESVRTDEETNKGDIILATVKGDIHDIGKNIVKVILQNYGYNVHDLGKDVSPETILEYAKEHDIKLIGLSALMTTTVPSMEKTIKLVKGEISDAKFMVGGAVLNSEYAQMIGADNYSKDAMEAVKYVKTVFDN